MTIILKKYDSLIELKTDPSKPHPKGKFISGFAKNIDDAKKRAFKYYNGNINFVGT